jgi:acyl carrier protein
VETTSGKPIVQIEDDLRTIAADVFPGHGVELAPGTPLFNGGLSLNSTQMIEFTLAFELFYGIDLEPELLTVENFATLRSLAQMLHDQLTDESDAF